MSVCRQGEEWSQLRKALAPKMLRPKDIWENLENFNNVTRDTIDHMLAIRGSHGSEGEIPDLEQELAKWATECKLTGVVIERRIEIGFQNRSKLTPCAALVGEWNAKT